MNRIAIAVFLTIILAWAGLGFAQIEAEYVKHIQEARHHVTMAVAEGEKSDATALVQHAQTGLDHIRAAQKRKSLPDLDKAAQSLEDAISQGQAGDVEKATARAKESVGYLDATLSGLGG
ncbi:small metal-binding protein SmbP [Methylocaldum szegediense]|uniref:Small metal-binding protein n=1 Tax=Methylocaldum szegediense TaxID=73780 RepID=A0ABN8X0Y1_9GAMM|nr:small metal-binding protein SmbP [Methylocaldum szegediense]CAI8795138.1 conserved protein of unknown function [Methylocaldum szegediense]